MKLLPLIIVSLAIGVGLGVGLARYDVGEVETRLFPGGGSVVSAGSDQPSLPATPKVEVDSEVHNFGTMQRGSTESHEFVFTNAGSAPLTLQVGRTTCKCTLGKVAERPLDPGESTPVRLEWTAKTSPGEFRQLATVITNDPLRSKVDLTVEGTVTELVGMRPKEFLIGRLSPSDERTAEIYIASFEELQTDEPFTATAEMDPSTNYADRYDLAVESVPAEESGIEGATAAVRITLRAGPGLPIGSLTEWVSIQTNQPSTETDGEGQEDLELSIPVLARVEGDVSVHGAGWSKKTGVLNLGGFASNEGKESKLLLSFKGPHAPQLRATIKSVNPEWLQVQLEEPREVREGVFHQPLKIAVPVGRPAEIRSGPGEEFGGVGPGDAIVRFELNHPDSSELDVKVRFVIAD